MPERSSDAVPIHPAESFGKVPQLSCGHSRPAHHLSVGLSLEINSALTPLLLPLLSSINC